MGVAAFAKGTLIEIDRRPYKLAREIAENVWQIEDQRSGRYAEYKVHELQKLHFDRQLMFVNDGMHDLDRKQAEARRKRDKVALSQLDEDELGRIKEIRAYVIAIEHLPATQALIEQAIHTVWQKLGSLNPPPSWITVLHWRKRYLNHGCDALALRHQHHRKGNRQRRYPDKVIEIVGDAIDRIFLTRERKTVTDTLDQAIVMVERENRLLPETLQLPLPTRRLVQGVIDELDEFDKYAARWGQLAAVRKFRGVTRVNVTHRPLECAEIDHTQLDLMVVDDDTGIPLGRPWITVCIDRNTRCILGTNVSFDPPSYLSVARCLRHAFLPKLDLKETFPGIDNDWLAHGVMEKLVVDNGLEFHSLSLESACLSLGIDLQYTPRKTPWWKGQVERFIGSMNRGIAHGNPGTTFSDIFEKDDYDPVKHAVIRYQTLKLILHKWIADVYHQKPHRSLDGVPPAIKWQSSIRVEDIMLPDDPESLDAILGKTEYRRLGHKGIELHGLFYNSPELIALRRRQGDKLEVKIRVDSGDLGHIHVIAPDDSEIIRVPCLHLDYARGLSHWQHNICKRHARLHLDLGDNPDAWREAKMAIAEIVQGELRGKRKKTNSKVARYAETGAAATSRESARPKADITADAPLPAPAMPVSATISASAAPPKKFQAIVEQRQSI